MLCNPRIIPAPKMCPKEVVASTAGKPKPPNKLVAGRDGFALGYLIVNLPKAIAKILAKSIIPPTVGLHSRVVGRAAIKVEVNTRFAPEI
jgi:hypothetical protein